MVTLTDNGLAFWKELRESTGRDIAADMPGWTAQDLRFEADLSAFTADEDQ
jgi:hypothetical protein